MTSGQTPEAIVRTVSPQLLSQLLDLLLRAAHDHVPVGKLASCRRRPRFTSPAPGDGFLDEIAGVTGMPHIDSRSRRLQRVRGMIEQDRHRMRIWFDLQDFDLVVGRRIPEGRMSYP